MSISNNTEMIKENKVQVTHGCVTENGAASNATTNVKRLDLYTKMIRDLPKDRLFTMLAESWAEDLMDTIVLIFQCRDCRGGKGERRLFRWCLEWLSKNHTNVLTCLLPLIIEYGRWDDMCCLMGDDSPVCVRAIAFVVDQLNEDIKKESNGESISLCSKWCPRERSVMDKEFHVVKKLCTGLALDKKGYRKMLVKLRAASHVVEVKMCAKKWHHIDYSKVPSQCMTRSRKAFANNDTNRFDAWKAKLESGDPTVKVNSATVDPHQIVKRYYRCTNTVDTVLEKQWDGIVDRVASMGTMTNSIVLSDVSGSMHGDPMIVSIALGILISGMSPGPFKNKVITFQHRPQFFDLTQPTLCGKVSQLSRAPWGGSTNLQAAFDQILSLAQTHDITDDQMPKTLYIISDMQFDRADCGQGGGLSNLTNFDACRKKYMDAGYTMPAMVFWNVRGNTFDQVCSASSPNTALVSGFSPSILKSVLNGKDFTPYGILRECIDDSRYDPIRKVCAHMEDDEL
jgi:hypothetical protein